MNELRLVELLLSRFGGRDDVYLIEKQPKGAAWVREPVTPELLARHVRGERRVGRASHEAACFVGCLDFDGKEHGDPAKAWADCRRVVELIDAETGIVALVERSRSGLGWHVWVFCDPADAPTLDELRRFLRAALRVAELPDDGAEGKGSPGIFPHPAGRKGVGCAPFLPWSGILNNGATGCGLFVDCNGEPLADQEAALRDADIVTRGRLLTATAVLEGIAGPVADEPKAKTREPKRETGIVALGVTFDALVCRLEDVESRGERDVRARCPVCGRHGLSVAESDGELLVYCHHEDRSVFADVLRAAGFERREARSAPERGNGETREPEPADDTEAEPQGWTDDDVPLDEPETTKAEPVRSTPEPARSEPETVEEPPPEPARSAAKTERVEVVVGPSISEMVDQAETALRDRPALGIYYRGNVLVRVLRDRSSDEMKFLARPPGSPTIGVAPVPWVREQIDRAAGFIEMRKDRPVPVVPPFVVAQTLCERGEWPFRPLESVVESPVFLPDGSVLDTPGYDPASGILYLPGERFPAIAARPGREDARRALDVLTDPMCDFPFVAPADRSVVLAAILTVLARPALSGPVPAFAFRSSVPGSGKGLLADVVSIVATGRVAARMTQPRDDEENRKRLLSLALAGVPIVLIDNISGAFGSRSLAAALTAETVADRLLGVSQRVEAPLRAVWMFTGNNLTFRGDVGRRIVPCDIDPGVEFPEDRTGFRYPRLLEHVRTARPEMVGAALTLLRAFHVAGRPAPRDTKGSFEMWNDVIRGTLLWAGAADPLATVRRVREQGDADREALAAGLTALRGRFAGQTFTAAEAVYAARSDAELLTALATFAGVDESKLDAKRLGTTLRDAAGRPVAGLTVRRAARDGHAKVVRWEITTEPEQEAPL